MEKILLVQCMMCLLLMPGCSKTDSKAGVMTPDEAKEFHMATLVVDGHNDILNSITRQSNANVNHINNALELPLNIEYRYTGQASDHPSMVDNGKNLADLRMDVRFDSRALFSNTNSPAGRFRHFDIQKMEKGGLNVAFTALWYSIDDFSGGNPIHARSRTLAMLNSLVWNEKKNSDVMAIARSYHEIMPLYNQGKQIFILTIEGGDMFTQENAVELIRQYHDLGVLVVGPIYTTNTPLASGGIFKPWGKDAVIEMQKMGMLIDVCHMTTSGGGTTDQTIAIAAEGGYPIVHTHGRPRGGFGQTFGLSDDQMRAIAELGGVVGVMMHIPGAIPPPDYRVEHILQNIDYAVSIAGADHVGLGSDFDGGITLPADMADASYFYRITQGLAERGYSKEDMTKILGGNYMRVLKTAGDMAEPRNVAQGITFIPQLNSDEYGWYVNSMQPTLSAKVNGSAVSYRVIVDGISYVTESNYISSTNTLSLIMPASFPNSGGTAGIVLRENFHVVTFEAVNSSGGVARETIIFRVDPSI